jgi:hypothetical protein
VCRPGRSSQKSVLECVLCRMCSLYALAETFKSQYSVIFCVCVCVCVCVLYIYIHIHTYVCMYVRMYGHVRMYVHTCCVIINPPIPSSRFKHFVFLRPIFFLLHKRANPRVIPCNDLKKRNL